MILIPLFWSSLIIVLGILLWRRRPRLAEVGAEKSVWKTADLRKIQGRHETASVLLELVNNDGAGAWPPNANHDSWSWPAPLRPYNDICLELIPLLPTAEPSLDDDVNNERRNRYRLLMQKVLIERVNIVEVEQIMATVEAGNWDGFPRDAYNGFYCCVAMCRHAYRWATIPVVKVAQNETVVDFPKELESTWSYLQRNFGLTADSGNHTALILYNFNRKGEGAYKINIHMSELIGSSEDAFRYSLYSLEILALPIYHEMVRAIICFEENDKALCVKHLENITIGLRDVLRVFYRNITESRVSKSVWMRYVQGFGGWGIGRVVNGEFIKYDGVSGSHILFFQALDAFLGMEHYLTDEEMIRYIPVNQRRLCIAFKKHSFRNKLKEESDVRIGDEIKKIVHQLKVYRTAHRIRVMPYLEQPAPERLLMTAGKSVLEGPINKDIKDALKRLDQMMVSRLKETV